MRCKGEKVRGGEKESERERVRESQTLLKFGHHGNTARLLVGLAGAAAT